MKYLANEQIPDFFSSLQATHEVRLPIMLPDGTRCLGHPGDGTVALFGGALPAKPTAAFFPHEGPVFVAASEGFTEPSAPEKPLLVVGFTSRDLACLRFIDRFFAEGWRDDLYFRSRQEALVVGISGYCGLGGTLLALADGDCDFELVWDRTRWLVVSHTGAGSAIVEGLAETVSDGTLERLRKEMAVYEDENEKAIRRASELIRADLVPDTFWSEIGDRCIACTGCNLACPTCTCFGVQDWRYAGRVERSRMWDSCQLGGFMREASGHNPLGTEGLRTRRRIHHKLAADPERWGEISCFVCGRCDAVCPTGIGIFAVARELIKRFGNR